MPDPTSTLYLPSHFSVTAQHNSIDNAIQKATSSHFSTICSNCKVLSVLGATSVPPLAVHSSVGTATPTSNSETQMSFDAIRAARRHIEHLDSELEQLLASQEKLHARRSALKHFVGFHSAAYSSSPASRLLPELLSEIFLIARSSSIPSSENRKASNSDWSMVPLQLAQVCTQWRDAALSTSRLWNSITFVMHQYPRVSQLRLLELWLTRSRKRPLHVHLADDLSEEIDLPLSPLDPAAQMLLAESHRFEKLQLSLFPFCGGWQRLAALRNNLPILRACTLRTIRPSRGNVHAPADRAIMDLLGDAPLLTDISTDRPRTLLAMDVPLEQCTILDLTEGPANSALSLTECISIIELCPRLRVFKFACGFSHNSLSFTSRPSSVHHAQLRELTITTHSSLQFSVRGLDSFFDALILPSLHTLDVNVSPGVAELQRPGFNAFLARTPMLNSLELRAEDVPASAAKGIISAASGLQYLRLRLGAMNVNEAVGDVQDGTWSGGFHTLFWGVDEDTAAFELGTDPAQFIGIEKEKVRRLTLPRKEALRRADCGEDLMMLDGPGSTYGGDHAIGASAWTRFGGSGRKQRCLCLSTHHPMCDARMHGWSTHDN